MRLFNPPTSHEDKRAEAVLFLAQRALEMLHDSTLDSNRLKFHNVITILDEFLYVIKHIQDGTLSDGNIQPLIEEFKSLFTSDEVAKSCVEDIDSHLIGMSDPGTTLSEKIKILELIKVKLDTAKYRNGTIELLKRSLSNNKWGKIESHLSNFFILLNKSGYHQSELLQRVKWCFFARHLPNEDLFLLFDKFKENFSEERSTYDVAFECPSDISQLTELLQLFKCKVVKAEPPYKWAGGDEKKDIMLVMEVKSFDPFSARNTAYDRLATITSLRSLFEHRGRPEASMKAYVLKRSPEDEKNRSGPQQEPEKIIQYKGKIILREPVKAIAKGFEFNESQIQSAVKRTLSNIRLTPESFVKIKRAIDLHAACINERNPGNVLLNLWIALESLVPKADGANKIDSIISAITPFLGFYYFRKNAKYISWWMEKIDKGFMEIAYSGVDELANVPSWQAFTAVASTSDFEGIWMSLEENYRNQPLVIYRIRNFRKRVSKGKEIKQAMISHIERVDWHIRRIYRKRNLLVHMGKDDNTTDLLVENLHEYFDLFIDGIIDIISVHENYMSIENIIRHSQIKWKSYMKLLGDNPGPVTHSLYNKLLLPEF